MYVSTHIIVPSFVSTGNSCSTVCKSEQYLVSLWCSVRVMLWKRYWSFELY